MTNESIVSGSSESAESRLIARYFKPLATHPGAFGLADDAAAITPPPGHDLVLKTDGLIGGVHFFPDDPPDGVARKALRVNLSDLAAKGAAPLGFLLAIALPKDFDQHWLAAFARGLGEDAHTYKCPLLGGDTDQTPGPISISVTAFGTLPQGTMVRRSGATAGDRVFVTGTIGDAALGLKVRQDAAVADAWQLDAAMRDHLVARYRLPQPRVALAELVRTNAAAAMDVSDGLAGDLGKLCRASGVSAEIDSARVPLSPAAARALAAEPALIEPILTGGEDYEILGAIAPDCIDAFRVAAQRHGVAVTDIGRMVQGDAPPHFLDRAGRPLAFARPAYSHF
jgi:thiamine-monophosphate kinase